jgi:LacI family transcriptional regulator
MQIDLQARDGKQASIADVAERAGVSATTVSHVLSGKRPVSEQTAVRVRRAMNDLRYVPNHSAKSLRSGSTQSIGLVIPDISNPYFAELAKGAEDAADAHGVNLVLCNTDLSRDREERYLTVLRGGAFDGMIYVAGARPLEQRLLKIARSFPLTVADEELNGVAAATIVSDHLKGGKLVGAHLRELGHRRVLYVGGPPELRSTADRGRGLREGLGAAGVVVSEFGDYRRQSAYDIVRGALSGASFDFTAVFAGNDLMAVGVLAALADAGIDVPAAVSVVGYDDVYLAQLVTPPLTTVRQPVYGIGRAAAEQLIRLTVGGDGNAQKRTILDVELVVRASTAEARA